MDALKLLVRANARRRWRAQLLLAVLVAVLVAVAVAAVAVPLAGARRAASAVDRFTEYSNAPDVEVQVGDEAARAEIMGLPEIERAGDYEVFLTSIEDEFNFALVAGPDGAYDHIARPRVLDGRIPDPSAADEVAVNEAAHRYRGYDVGDTIDAIAYTPEQFFSDDSGPPAGPQLQLRVVGVVRLPDQLQPRVDDAGALASPAFYEQYRETVGGFDGNVFVALRDGVTAMQFEEVVRAELGPAADEISFDAFAVAVSESRDAIRVQAYALAGIAFVLALVAAFVVGQALAREIDAPLAEQRTLSELGMSRRAGAAVIGAGPALGVVWGVLGGIVLSIAMSPLLPFGLARRADIDPGLHADWLVLSLVALGTLVFGIAATWLYSAATVRGRASRTRRSPVVDVAAGSLSPQLAIGVRYALRPQAGTDALPARSVLLGVTLACVGLVGAATFARTLDWVGDTPARWGWNWDSRAEMNIGDDGDVDAVVAAVQNDAGVRDAAVMSEASAVVNGTELQAYGIEAVKGELSFVLRDGRFPRTHDEIALGPLVTRSLDVSIDDTVDVVGADGSVVTLQLVGTALGPPLDEAPGRQALFTRQGLEIIGQGDGDTTVLLRYEAGRQGAAETRLGEEEGAPLSFTGYSRPFPPDGVAQYLAIDAVPVYLALFFGLLGTMALVHVLVVTGRRRRRDLALLRAFGLPRRHTTQILSAQGVTIVVVGMVFGLPFGVLAGRAVWRVIADRLGLSTTIVVPVAIVGALLAAALVTAFVAAFFASRPARRAVPAVALRTE